MSELQCLVVPVKLKTHPNANSLSIVKVWDYNVVVRTDEFKDVEQAIYLPVDSVLPETMASKMAYLKGNNRIRAVKLRGTLSEGMLIPDPKKEYRLGEDVTAFLGIVKYEQPLSKNICHGSKGKILKEELWFKRYTSIENIKKYKNALDPEEIVCVTEKIHGTSARFGYFDGKFVVGSHNTQRFYTDGVARTIKYFLALILLKLGFKRPYNRIANDEKSWWVIAANQHNIKNKLRKFPGYIFYGEIFGSGVQDLHYDVPPGTLNFRVFDIFNIKQNKFLNYWDVVHLTEEAGFEMVPLLWDGPWKYCDLEKHTKGMSILAPTQIREGCVVKPIKERLDDRLGRIILKSISEKYLLRNEGTEFK